MRNEIDQTLADSDAKFFFSNEMFRNLQNEIENTGYVFVQLVSDSMSPVLKTGDAAIAKPIKDHNRIKKFDILVFFDGEKLLCHYFVGRSSFKDADGVELYLTRGLSAREFDLPVRKDHVLGKVEKKIPFLLKLKELFKDN